MLLTTKQLASILSFMKKSEHFSPFLKSLPLREKTIHGKTGSMSFIRGYAGYAGDIAFAILINQCLDSHLMHQKIDRVLSKIAL